MSVLHSIVPLELVYDQPLEMNVRDEIVYKNMLVEVEYDQDNIVLSRIINGPLQNYLDDNYLPGKIIGKRHSYKE